jgi:hypothetical protein
MKRNFVILKGFYQGMCYFTGAGFGHKLSNCQNRKLNFLHLLHVSILAKEEYYLYWD